MNGIKKYVFKILIVTLALLLVLNTSTAGALAASRNANEVTPSAGDYEVSGGTITGLKDDYLKGLTEEQKQNIRLVIPDKVKNSKGEDITVTSIGEKAFSKWYNTRYDGYDFVALDLSNTTSLQSIGKDAFYNCKRLVGDLFIPDTVVRIGESAFRECTAFDGDLHLPKALKEISKYAFWNCAVKGILILPSGTEKIGDHAFGHGNAYRGYSGTLTIPAAVKEIGSSTFAQLNGITKLVFAGNEVSEIKGSAFLNTGITGVVNLPNSIQSIESKAFQGTNIETIYLPKITRTDTENFIASQAFGSCPKLNAIICADKEDYQVVSKIITSTTYNSAQVCYPINVIFDDGKGGVYENKKCLYNLPYNFYEDSNHVWRADSNYRFPEIKSGDTKKLWSLSTSSLLPVSEKDKVAGAGLYAVKKLEDPTITYSAGIDKVYDGKANILSANATHPLGKKVSEAKPGDVIFQYTWNWNTINSTPAALSGFDKTEYDTGPDVRAPFAISCYVTVQACVLKADGKTASVFYKESHEFAVDLKQADPVLNHIPRGAYKLNGDDRTLPAITLSENDSPGTLTWDENQTLQEGYGMYSWTYRPAKNAEGNYNYKSIKGTTELYCSKEVFDDKTMNEKLEKLPDFDNGVKPTEKQKEDILDAYLAYGTVGEDIKEAITAEQGENLYHAVAALPQVKTDAVGLSIDNEKDLVKNLSTTDAAAIKANDDVNCKIAIVSEEKNINSDEREVINKAAGSDGKIGITFDVKAVKTLESNGSTIKTDTLDTVAKPLKLVFPVPKSLQSASRKFFIVRLHKDLAGTVVSEKLEDEDNDPATITVTSDKFSVYAIAYTEHSSNNSSNGGSYVYNITASAGEHGSISPSGIAYVYYGSSKTYEFTPEEGYQVSDVLVDGVSIGTVSSYTFEDITRPHTIAVVFQAVADQQKRIISGVKATKIKASSSVSKGAITIKWKKSKGFKVDYYQVFRSKKKNSGYSTKPFYTTKSGTQKSYKNTKKLMKGTRYYYKVRGVRIVEGKKVFTQWSNKTWRVAR